MIVHTQSGHTSEKKVPNLLQGTTNALIQNGKGSNLQTLVLRQTLQVKYISKDINQ
jgi:hypothetical protein